MSNYSVLHIVTRLDVGGLEILVRDIARRQRAKGCNVYIGCFSEREGVLDREFEADGIKVFTFMNKPYNKLCLPSYIFNVYRTIKQTNADVVHCHISGVVIAVVPIILARIIGIKNIVRTLHVSIPRGELNWLQRLCHTLDLAFSKLAGVFLVAVSSDVAENKTSVFKIPQKWIEVIPNGIEVSKFIINGPSGLSVETLIGKRIPRQKVFLIICVARFHYQKNHELQIRAMAELFKRSCDLEPHLLLVGVGEKENILRTLVKELRIEGNVHFLGLRRDIPQLLRESDAFVMSSFSEGLPISVIEAMTAGKPIVATNVPGLINVVIDKQTGFLVELNQPDKFADAIMKLMTDEDLRHRQGNMARKVALEKYSLETCLESYEQLYQVK